VSYLFDVNANLIEVYTVVRNQVEELIEALSHHYNDKEYYYKIRALDAESLTSVQRAARFIFLNRTCYNGLYRVNKQGKFNVPFGKYKNPTICDQSGLRDASAVLQSAHLDVGDFEKVLAFARKGDFVYFDPPYEPISSTSNFTSYTSNGFSGNDQRRLAEVFGELNERECFVMLSNSNARLIYELYQPFHIHEINARRAINSDPNGRGIITELLVTNYILST
jgi:DNA adenine methylase